MTMTASPATEGAEIEIFGAGAADQLHLIGPEQTEFDN